MGTLGNSTFTRPAVPAIVGLAMVGLLLAGCGGSGEGGPPPANIVGTATPGGDASAAAVGTDSSPAAPGRSAAVAPNQRPQVVMRTPQGEVVIELFQDQAPETTYNFLSSYVDKGFYDNTLIHYVDQHMLIAGGFDAQAQPKPDGGYIRNESDNGLSNRRGTLAMSREPDYPDSATSVFFINTTDNPGFDHQDEPGKVAVGGNGYCVFGKVIRGMEVVDAIAQSPVEDREELPRTPVAAIVIESIRRQAP